MPIFKDFMCWALKLLFIGYYEINGHWKVIIEVTEKGHLLWVMKNQYLLSGEKHNLNFQGALFHKRRVYEKSWNKTDLAREE